MHHLTRRDLVAIAAAGALQVLGACGLADGSDSQEMDERETRIEGQYVAEATEKTAIDSTLGTLEAGSLSDRGFVVDEVLRDTPAGDVHFSLRVPDSYDGSRQCSLYVHCPGWEGLWFQGVGAHLVEDFAFVANDYVGDIIVATPQLDDWGEVSACKTIALTEWLAATYDVNPGRVYLSGYSGGGETVSIVLGLRPDLYRRALHLSSRWDGNVGALVAARVPVRIVIGESDDYYGSEPAILAHGEIRTAYLAEGFTQDEVDELVALDVRDAAYFEGQGYTDQHAGGAALFSHDKEIMGWLFAEGH